MQLKRQIPNFITLLNLFSGSVAVLFAVEGNLVMAALFVVLGILLDFFDGFAARILDVKSELGLQLDSLADMITSGLVQGIVMFQLFLKSMPSEEIHATDWTSGNDLLVWDLPVLPLFGLVVTLAAGYRLANFNIDERQTDSFIGLPAPANALLILSLPLILIFQPQPQVTAIILNPWFLVGLTLFCSYMLNAEIPLFSLKFKSFGFAENKLRYLFIVLSLLLLIFFQFIGIPLLIGCYVLLSVIFTEKKEE